MKCFWGKLAIDEFDLMRVSRKTVSGEKLMIHMRAQEGGGGWRREGRRGWKDSLLAEGSSPESGVE